MPDRISALGQVLSRDLQQISVHADNLANANTVGFRQRIAGAEAAPTATSDLQGRLRATGRPLDIAIMGDGWLVETGKADATWLTRAGNLVIDAEGYLASSRGNRMQGQGGSIFIGNAAASRIDNHGMVYANNEIAGQLLVVQAPEPATAAMLPDGRWQVTALPPAREDAKVVAGVLEYANVDIAGEMAGMMMNSRHLESTQRALQLYDTTLSTGISQLGKE